MTSERAKPSTEVIPPIVHALGGSMGSALALMMLYPLERARIEMQASAAVGPGQNFNDNQNLQDNEEDEEEEENDHTQKHRGRSLFVGTFSGLSTGSRPLGERESQTESWTTENEDEMLRSETDSDLFQEAISSYCNERSTRKLGLGGCLQKLWEHGELYRGLGPIVVTLATSNFVFFYVHEFLKQLIVPDRRETGRMRKQYLSLLASCLAGVCNVLITNPLWVSNLRIVTGESSSGSLVVEIVRVAREEGIQQLWKGTATSILLVSNPVIQFFLYEQLKSAQVAGRSNLSAFRAFITGALAKAVATAATYPLQLAQSVLRLQRLSTDEGDDSVTPWKGTWDCLRKIYARDGVDGLYTGMRAKLLQTVLTAAFTFLTYEQILRAVHETHKSLVEKRTRI